MVWPMLRGRRPILAAALGVTICLVLIPFTPIGVPILCASLAVLVGIPAPRPGDGMSERLDERSLPA